MSADIYSLVAKLDQIAEGQNAQQKSVPQLPALFKPKDISPVLGAPEKQHPTHKYFVGGESTGSLTPAQQKLKDKYVNVDIDAELEKLKPAIAKAYNDYQYGGSNVWHLGKDEYDRLSAIRQEMTYAKKLLGLSEAVAKEDVVTKDRKSLGDYFQSVADAVKKDPDLIDRVVDSHDVVGPAVKTITTDDGHEIKIHGNEDDGFRISIKDRPSKSTFKNLAHAEMACEMFCNRRRQAAESADYIEEKR